MEVAQVRGGGIALAEHGKRSQHEKPDDEAKENRERRDGLVEAVPQQPKTHFPRHGA